MRIETGRTKLATWLLAAVALLPAGLCRAQEEASPHTGTRPNTIVVAADGDYDAAPDVAEISFRLRAQEKTSAPAYAKVAKAAARVRDLLKQAGIDPKVAELSGYSVQPVYNWSSSKRKVSAFLVTSSVMIRLTDFSKAAPLLEGLADMDEAENQNFTYALSDPDTAKNKAIEKAYARLRSYAETVARASGRGLGEMSSASVDLSERFVATGVLANVYEYSAEKRARSALPTPPPDDFGERKITVNAHVSAVFTLK